LAAASSSSSSPKPSAKRNLSNPLNCCSRVALDAACAATGVTEPECLEKAVAADADRAAAE
jgi:hypothetical protein